MNERIKALVGQAKFMAEETTNKKISKNAELDAFAAKFAELIVRDMLGLLEQYSRDSFPEDIMDDFDNAYLSGLRNAREAVKKHFGVEE